MAYSFTVDERYAGGFLEYSAGFYDASNLLNEVSVLAENSTGYGTSIDDYNTADIDVFSLGILSPGNYLVDVDDYTWDFANMDFGSVSNFKVLDSLGYIVDTSYTTFSDIEFTVLSEDTYYVLIEGPSFGEAQYSVKYQKTGELTNNNNTISFSNPEYININQSVNAVLNDTHSNYTLTYNFDQHNYIVNYDSNDPLGIYEIKINYETPPSSPFGGPTKGPTDDYPTQLTVNDADFVSINGYSTNLYTEDANGNTLGYVFKGSEFDYDTFSITNEPSFVSNANVILSSHWRTN